jgi:hypothetical protein
MFVFFFRLERGVLWRDAVQRGPELNLVDSATRKKLPGLYDQIRSLQSA